MKKINVSCCARCPFITLGGVGKDDICRQWGEIIPRSIKISRNIPEFCELEDAQNTIHNKDYAEILDRLELTASCTWDGLGVEDAKSISIELMQLIGKLRDFSYS